eukprot:TRINITY_DN2865_c0_g2_i1.p1 TRINITY_DN2865_c0_g2~~TRINITY_DN2865_c0_g2_i1.p1  ORF type:complete len:425 (-),score=80.84 TRINITY_DN2865_c0_g2_i1:381-1655(-)
MSEEEKILLCVSRGREFEQNADQVSEDFELADQFVIDAMKGYYDIIARCIERGVDQAKLIVAKSSKRLSSRENSLTLPLHLLERVLVKHPLSLSNMPSSWIEVNLLSGSLVPLPPTWFGNLVAPLCIPKSLSAQSLDQDPKFVLNDIYSVQRDVVTIQEPRGEIIEWQHKNFRLVHPWGIAVHPFTGNLYVTDRSQDTVVVLSPQHEFLFNFGHRGTSQGAFTSPQGISISPDGTQVCVVDYGNHRLCFFDEHGKFIRNVGGSGRESGHMSCPYHCTFDLDGCAYVTDINNDRIQKFTRDGQFLLEFGKPRTNGEMGIPYGLATMPDGSILAIGHGQNFVKRFNTKGELQHKYDIVNTSQDNDVFRSVNDGFGVCVKQTNSVLFYDRDGKKIHSISGSHPRGCAFTADGTFYVCESQSQKITFY